MDQSITFIHGWGCHPIAKFNRGYFGSPSPFQSTKKIVTHSFGLHLVPSFEGVEELIICSGFVTFVAKKKIVERMLKRLQEDPYKVLSDFRGEKVNDPIDKNLLHQDLERLSTSIFDTDQVKSIPKISIIHGRNDLITPFEWGQELHQKIPQSLFFPFEGGHFDSIQEAHRLGFF